MTFGLGAMFTIHAQQPRSLSLIGYYKVEQSQLLALSDGTRSAWATVGGTSLGYELLAFDAELRQLTVRDLATGDDLVIKFLEPNPEPLAVFTRSRNLLDAPVKPATLAEIEERVEEYEISLRQTLRQRHGNALDEKVEGGIEAVLDAYRQRELENERERAVIEKARATSRLSRGVARRNRVNSRIHASDHNPELTAFKR